MNKKQWAYMCGRFNDARPDLRLLAKGSAYSTLSYLAFAYGLGIGFLDWGLSLGLGFMALKNITYGYALNGAVRGSKKGIVVKDGINIAGLKEIRKNKEFFPLEFSESVVLDDVEGLEMLLEATSESWKEEWGTVINVHDEKGVAVVDNIVDIMEEGLEEIFIDSTENSLQVDLEEAIKLGYNGMHHYHPDGNDLQDSGRHFSINFVDRFKPANWINLLSFNMPEGPEIIAFNRQFVYIPKDNSKRELVRASPKDIKKYLKD
jgi:hypothetical protein